MGSEANITGWITFFIGLYSLAAGIGELRQPGFWAGMIREVRASSAIQFLTGIFLITLGAAIYLVLTVSLSICVSYLEHRLRVRE